MVRRPKFDNPDVLPFALYQLGGAGEFIDVEDVFLRSYQLAPERFGWRTKTIPNYKTLAEALQRLERHHPGLMLKTPGGLTRQLSAEGIQWVREHQAQFDELQQQPGKNPPTRRPGQRLLNALRDSPLVQTFLGSGEVVPLLKHEVADVLMCSPDSPAAVWRERLETFRSAAADVNREDLMRFLDYLKVTKAEWFQGGE